MAEDYPKPKESRDMVTEIGHIEAIFRYPIKSMRGEALTTTTLGLHGIDGDRRYVFRRVGDRSGFPWLNASKLAAMIHFTPERSDGALTHVRTPEGASLPLHSDELAAELGRRHGAPVELMQLKDGIFDDASLSLITSATVDELGRLSATRADVRRFRPNILVRASSPRAFAEDAWIGGQVTFGDSDSPPTISVTQRDTRCVMVNIDPDGGAASPEILKAVTRANECVAGVYGTVTRAGQLSVGQRLFLQR